jgi:hypothetical protein
MLPFYQFRQQPAQELRLTAATTNLDLVSSAVPLGPEHADHNLCSHPQGPGPPAEQLEEGEKPWSFTPGRRNNGAMTSL